MKILVADDEPITRRRLVLALTGWGYEVVEAADGQHAWDLINVARTATVAVLDWEMPGLNGPEICRRLAPRRRAQSLHVILLTGRTEMEDQLAGFEAGADDYLKKPFELAELRARIEAGRRSLALQDELRARVQELQETQSHIEELRGLLPICSYCKSVRDDKNYWHQVERYFGEHSGLQFSHGICPPCYEKVMGTIPGELTSRPNSQKP